MICYPGKKLTAFDLAGVFGKAYLRSSTPEKAIKGFACCGLWLFDENIFQTEFESQELAITFNDGQVNGSMNTNQTAETIASLSPEMPQLRSNVINNISETVEAVGSRFMETTQLPEPPLEVYHQPPNHSLQVSSQLPAAATEAQDHTGVAILSKGKEKLFLLFPFFHHFVISFR